MEERKASLTQEKTTCIRLISPVGRSYSWSGLKKLAAALCAFPEKYVDDTEHGCKNSTGKGINHKNE